LKQRNSFFKKKVIAYLLGFSCLISLSILIWAPKPDSSSLQNLSQADSLIYNELGRFNIHPNQISSYPVKVDSVFTRKVYYVDVPPTFSKTQLHADLNRQFHDYEVKTPARVNLMDKTMDIYLYHNQSIIRTLHLRNDQSIQIKHYIASIIMTFDEVPSNELIQDLISFGEPIPLVVSVHSAMRADEVKKQLSRIYNRLGVWLKNDDGQNLLENHETTNALKELKHLQEIAPGTPVISFANLESEPVTDFKEALTRLDLTYIDVHNALILDPASGEADFKAELQQWVNRARQGERPVALIKGNVQSLRWLYEVLPDLKKKGLVIRPPSKLTF